MNVAIEAAIIGGFVGAVVGGGIAYYLSRRAIKASFELIRLQDFNKAAAEFRDAFLPVTTFLKHNANIGGLGSSNDLGGILRDGYLRHLKALEIFKSYLLTTDKAAINNAWDEYCHPNGIPPNPDEKRDFRFNDYRSIEDFEGTEKAKNVALQKIHKILEFANIK